MKNEGQTKGITETTDPVEIPFDSLCEITLTDDLDEFESFVLKGQENIETILELNRNLTRWMEKQESFQRCILEWVYHNNGHPETLLESRNPLTHFESHKWATRPI